MAGTVRQLTAATFDGQVVGSPVPVVVDFWAEWCGPCHALAPVLAEVAAEHEDDLAIYSLDIEEYPEMATRFGVMSFPTMLVFDRGELVHRLVGARGKHRLLADLSSFVKV